MSKKVESDAGAFVGSESEYTGVGMLPANPTAEQMQKHFSKVFGSGCATGKVPFFSTSAVVTTQAPTVDWDNFSRNFTGPAVYVPAEKAAPTKYTKATYNFINSKVENAALGNKGSVTFNKHHETYKEGAKKTEFNVGGGNFAEANLGGTAVYNNKDSKIVAGGGGDVSGSLSSAFVDISEVPPPFSPEEYLSKLLQTGVTSDQLIDLLEKEYTIVNLSYALPNSSKKREMLVETMLKIADLE